MNVKTACPQYCPERSPTCHATCATYRAAWEANMRRYKANAERRKVNDLVTKSVGESIRKIGKKVPQY